MNKSKVTAFTLAEVLITLGIIGVVAAMTIPNLISSVGGAEYRAQFKKTLSTVNQANLMGKAQYGYSVRTMKSEYRPTADNQDPAKNRNLYALFAGTMNGEWNLQECNPGASGCDYTNEIRKYADSIMYAFKMADGSEIYTGYWLATKGQNTGCKIGKAGCIGWIDVNGAASGPNELVKCSDGTTLDYIKGPGTMQGVINPQYKDCEVSDDTIGDLFPYFVDGDSFVPLSNAARAVMSK